MPGHPRPAPDKSSRTLAQRFPGIHLLRINQCAKLITASRCSFSISLVAGNEGRGAVESRDDRGRRRHGKGHRIDRRDAGGPAQQPERSSRSPLSRVRSINHVISDLRSRVRQIFREATKFPPNLCLIRDLCIDLSAYTYIYTSSKISICEIN